MSSEYVDLFINDHNIKLNRNAKNFKKMFDIDKKMLEKEMSRAILGLVQKKTPGEQLLALLDQNNFSFLMYLAGRGLLEFIDDLAQNSTVRVMQG